MSGRSVVVMKFGGTSVADRESRRALTKHVRERTAQDDVVVVVSAMGRNGSPYATDTLLGLLDGRDTSDDPREADKIAACGEIISSVVVASELRAAGIESASLSGIEAGIITDGRAGEARVVRVEPDRVRALLTRGVVPVVAGFQGVGPDGTLTTLGRGGSDTTACALAAALDAKRVEIYTDVEGVMTADPAVTPKARILDRMQYEELFQMARAGSRVVHAPAAEIAQEAGVPMVVRSTFASAPGTWVLPAAEFAPDRVATAVSHVDGVTRFVVDLPPDGTEEHMSAQRAIYSAMADAGVSLDMFTPVGDSMVFSVKADDAERASGVLTSSGLDFRVEPDLAKVTLVGAGMHGVPGVMARVCSALADAGVAIRQTADSHTTISVLVCQNNRDEAIEALHDAFGLWDPRDGGEKPADA